MCIIDRMEDILDNYTYQKLDKLLEEREDIKMMVYGRVIWKSDQEPSIVALRELVRKYLGVAVTLDTGEQVGEKQGLGVEETEVGESPSNGDAEIAVKLVQKQSRTIKDNLEAWYGKLLDGKHDSMSWLVRHSAGVKSRLQVGNDGKTAYERLKGRKYKKALVPFGECVWHLKPNTY